GRHVLTSGWDGTVRLWEAASGRELVLLMSYRDGGWAAVAPDGRFDTSDLERVRGLHWLMADDPFTLLPVEAFMADFYEPRLLPRLLAGEAFPELRGLGERNRVQPVVAITDVTLAAGGTASVTVSVEGLERAYGGVTHESGAHDLRLFRDGQLVGWADGEVVAGTGRTALTFDGVALPTDADTLTFSAYAFNADRFKSRSPLSELALPPAGVPERPRRAYVVSLGVDAFADPAWDLRFAANDARAFQETLPPLLEASGVYDEVVAVPLLAAHDGQGAGAADARKATLRAVLDLLAGRPVPDGLRARIPQADRLAQATPDDLVLITASSHGYVDAAGVFY